MPSDEKKISDSAILFMPVERMWRRVEIAKAESDTTYFHDLTYFGEMLRTSRRMCKNRPADPCRRTA